MPHGAHDVHAGRSVLLELGLVAVGIAYAWIAAGTKPFTTGADIAAAVPLAVATAVAIGGGRWRAATRAPRADGRRNDGSFWPWVAVLGAIALLELVSYLVGLGRPRNGYPTLSSLYDQVSSVRGVKALFFLGWLSLGWVIVCR